MFHRLLAKLKVDLKVNQLKLIFMFCILPFVLPFVEDDMIYEFKTI